MRPMGQRSLDHGHQRTYLYPNSLDAPECALQTFFSLAHWTYWSHPVQQSLEYCAAYRANGSQFECDVKQPLLPPQILNTPSTPVKLRLACGWLILLD